MKSGWRSNRPRDTVLGGTPARLLLGGIVVAGFGFLTFLIAFAVAFVQWTQGEDRTIVNLVAWAGLWALPCGAVLVVLALGWWAFRIARWVWRNTPD